MSNRHLNSLRFGSFALGALALSASVMAHTPPPAKADAAKPAAAAAAPAQSTPTPVPVMNEKDPDVVLARKAALTWLALADAGQFEDTWVEAASSFQKAQTKEAWAKGLSGARPAVGKLVTRTYLNHEIRTKLPNLPDGKYITVRFNSVFDKHKDGGESVTLVKDGTRGWRMMSYFLK